MRIVVRADAGPHEGVGHVMRALALAEFCMERGDEVTLLTNDSQVAWLENHLLEHPIDIERVAPSDLATDRIEALGADLVIIDSYRISAGDISNLDNSGTPVAFICDGDARGVKASLIIDHNLGSDELTWPDLTSQVVLAGSKFTISRSEVIKQRRLRESFEENSPLRVLFVAGGADFNEAAIAIARVLVLAGIPLDIRFITDEAQGAHITKMEFGEGTRVSWSSPSSDMLSMAAQSDIVISAAGTSAWDFVTIGIPSAYFAVVGNQVASLARIERAGVGVNLGSLEEIVNDPSAAFNRLTPLLSDPGNRREISERARGLLDGEGRARIHAELRRIASNAS
jgi:spore coat polysaccharide biosynthesis predicted glycosyltransferase SpsG